MFFKAFFFEIVPLASTKEYLKHIKARIFYLIDNPRQKLQPNIAVFKQSS